MTHQDPLPAESDGDTLAHMMLQFQREQLTTNINLQRRDMMWRNMRAFAIALAFIVGPVIYVVSLKDLLYPESFDDGYAAMVRIDGEIASSGGASARKIVAALEKAFEDEDAVGVVLLINSPGGSPVQSSIIHQRILELKAEHPDRAVVAVGEDYVTSGAYWIASAADRIYVNQSTMTGSIGVIMAGFGLQNIVDELAIERRVITAGEHKLRMDMYQPLREEDRDRIKALLAETHEHFKEAVRQGRGKRLCAQDEVLFSGDVWTGEEAVRLCLVDALGNLYATVRAEFDVPNVKDFTLPPSWIDQVTGSIGAQVGAQVRGAMAPWINSAN